MLTALACCLLPWLTGCGNDFAPATVIERLRIIGVRADYPEICPFGPDRCPAGTFRDKVRVSVLAVDPDGVVADGMHAGGPYLREGHALDWALCTYSLRGGEEKDPDCTRTAELPLSGAGPDLSIPTMSLVGAVMASLQKSGIDMSPQAAVPAGDDPYAVMELPQSLGVAIRSATEREWAVKAVTLSDRVATEQNLNPSFDEVTLEGVKVAAGDEPFAEVETGYAYRIGWKYPDAAWQTRKVKSADGVAEKKEQLSLSFWSTGGSFSQDEPLPLWLEDDKTNELFWRPPLEVPAEGKVVTLFFKLNDQRGGCDWAWGRVKVMRGSGAGPR